MKALKYAGYDEDLLVHRINDEKGNIIAEVPETVSGDGEARAKILLLKVKYHDRLVEALSLCASVMSEFYRFKIFSDQRMVTEDIMTILAELDKDLAQTYRQSTCTTHHHTTEQTA
jgi:hypothetical protein